MVKMIESLLPAASPFLEKIEQKTGMFRMMSLVVFFRALLGLFFPYYLRALMLSTVPRVVLQDNPLESFVGMFFHGVMLDMEIA